MSDIKHTPGPWENERQTIVSSDRRGRILATVNHISLKTEEAQANAKLIATSPDLLQCCIQSLKDLVETAEMIGGGAYKTMPEYKSLRAAIDKATK